MGTDERSSLAAAAPEEEGVVFVVVASGEAMIDTRRTIVAENRGKVFKSNTV